MANSKKGENSCDKLPSQRNSDINQENLPDD